MIRIFCIAKLKEEQPIECLTFKKTKAKARKESFAYKYSFDIAQTYEIFN